jgi:ribosome-binding protein aMBF1 (putative translation factor)
VDLKPQAKESSESQWGVSSGDCHHGTEMSPANDHIATAFGRVLREQRETRGISQEDLALSADVDRSFVSQMERGIRQPTLTTLVKLCKALGVAPSTIVGRMERLLD